MPLKRELIYIDEKDETDRVARYGYQGDKLYVVFSGSNKTFIYSRKRAKIVKTAVSSDKAFRIFAYLTQIAEAVGLKTEEGDNILSRSFEDIAHIPNELVLSPFLNGSLPANEAAASSIDFFPFGFNLSQKEAVQHAFNNQLSVIEGPPGTGKTQTILNIIANAVLKGQSVAVVSSNNSATKNVFEKLEKNGIGFIAALLGSAQNKKDFIASQAEIPDLSAFALSADEKAHLTAKSTALLGQLTAYLDKKNQLAALRLEVDNLSTEYAHFKATYSQELPELVALKGAISTTKILALWVRLDALAATQKRIGFVKRLLFRFKYGIKDTSFFKQSLARMIFSCQAAYYPAKIEALSSKIATLERSLEAFDFDGQMKTYATASMHLLKAALYHRYEKQKRTPYTLADLRRRAADFIEDYPVVMSTTYSLRQSLSSDISYDFVIIDEASQVDLATGALALSCAKRAVIVGDRKQLPNVVDNDMQEKTDLIFERYKLPKAYRYATNSLLSSLLELLPGVPKTLLREHYRCHPKIIAFCNEKFYDNQLIIHTAYAGNRQPLLVYKTVQGNHARARMNQRQIDMIKHEIIPNEQLEHVDLGIVTPYRNQTNALQATFEGTRIMADTVDKFQGRENDVIILSTVDNAISEFTDNANRLNVAVSRAIEQLILVVNGNEEEQDGNIADLIKYMEYNNVAVVQSALHSIFDLLYKGYEAERAKAVSQSRKVSAYDSENLMFALIKDVLKADPFTKYDVLPHYPLRQLIKDFSALEAAEAKYAAHPATHLDFLIYNKLGKAPVLGVEVDGYAFHKAGSKQAERDQLKDRILGKYHFPILRFKTNESNEREKLTAKLLALQRIR